MCKCTFFNGFGSKENYTNNQVTLRIPDTVILRYNRQEHDIRETVVIDNCLVDEIKLLWSIGMETTGCCCGHNQKQGFISITDNEEDLAVMKQLGYVQYKHPDPTRLEHFIPMGSAKLVDAINHKYLKIPECKRCGGDGWYFVDHHFIDVPEYCDDCNPNNEKGVELPIFSGVN